MATKSGSVHEALLDSNFIGSSSLITIRKQTLERVAGFDETLVSHLDWDLCLRVAKVSRIALVPHCLVKRHLGSDQISRSLRRICEGRERIFQKHRSDMKPRTVALHLSRVALLLFNYDPRRARGLALEGLRLQPLQPLLVGGLAASVLGMDSYRWLFKKLAKVRDKIHVGRAEL